MCFGLRERLLELFQACRYSLFGCHLHAGRCNCAADEVPRGCRRQSTSMHAFSVQCAPHSSPSGQVTGNCKALREAPPFSGATCSGTQMGCSSGPTATSSFWLTAQAQQFAAL